MLHKKDLNSTLKRMEPLALGSESRVQMPVKNYRKSLFMILQ